MPTLNAANDAVIYIESQKTICNVEVDDKGCIKATKPNMQVLSDFLGINDVFGNGIGPFGWGAYSPYSELIPAVFNYWGYYNRNAQDPQIVHIFHNGIRSVPFVNQAGNQLTNSVADQNIARTEAAFTGTILVTYQINGEEPGAEILIPEYANDALVMGILYRQAKLNPKDRDRDQTAYNAYRREKVNLFKYLNPINLDQIAKLPTLPRTW